MFEPVRLELPKRVSTQALPGSDRHFYVIMAGVKGGGRSLTGLREHIGNKGYAVSSLSTRFGVK